MVERPLEHARKLIDLISEIKLHLEDKKAFRETLQLLNKSYQRGQFGYMRYQTLKRKLLKDKTKKEWEEYYDSYIFGLLKQLEFYNSKIFYDVFSDKTTIRLKIPKKIAKEKPKKKPFKLPKSIVPLVEEEVKPLLIKKKIKKILTTESPDVDRTTPDDVVILEAEDATGQVPAEVGEETPPENAFELKVDESDGTEAKPVKVDAPPDEVMDAEIVGEVPKSSKLGEPQIGESKGEVEELEAMQADYIPKTAEEVSDEEGQQVLEKTLFKGGIESKLGKSSKQKDVLPWLEDHKKKKRPLLERFKGLFVRQDTVFDQMKEQAGQTEQEEDAQVEFKQMFSMKFIKNLLSRKGADQFISEKTEISSSILALKRYKVKEMEKQSDKSLDTSVLLEEAHRIKSIIQQRRKFTVYEHSTLGAVANIMVKRVSLSMIETFPDFFKQIYDNLRLANMKILSNTYVNIMMLGVMIVSMITYGLSAILFFFQGVPLVLVLVRALVIALLFGAIVFMSFYLYPNVKIKRRRRSINTNMPFAINHMSAVSSSGVPPEAMFRLIAESKEYQEISIELRKVTDFIEIFGYDILTAIKSVSATTPSPRLKAFFEGFVSNIETGGDLKQYLTQRAEEAMLQYKLERQKYLESISTYSDIYTGLLIAAPLFFVVALSLVSLLGGKVGGMEVNTLIAVGTYMVIPAMNVAFIFFLELTQPEV